MTTKTNPVYAFLAYRKTVILECIDHLRDNCMSLSSDKPKKELICYDVYREDSVVPEESVASVVDELVEAAERQDLELGMFEFGKVRNGYGLLGSKKTEDGGTKDAKASDEESGEPETPSKRKRRRSRRRA